jgi:hypothetical protein
VSARTEDRPREPPADLPCFATVVGHTAVNSWASDVCGACAVGQKCRDKLLGGDSVAPVRNAPPSLVESVSFRVEHQLCVLIKDALAGLGARIIPPLHNMPIMSVSEERE